jgi:hypothetical protein
MLLRSRIIINDTQLLDGEFFLWLGERLTSREERELVLPKLEIRTRDPDLRRARLSFIMPDPATRTCKPFVFSAIRDVRTRDEVTSQLAEIEAKGNAPAWRSLEEALIDLQVDAAEVERLSEGWQQWDRIQAKHRDIFKTWDRRADLEEHLRTPVDLETTSGFEALQVIKDSKWNRSMVHQVVAQLLRSSETGTPQRRDAEAIERWYQRAYNSAVGASHGANVILTLHRGRETVGAPPFPQSGEISLPKGALLGLGAIPAATFNAMSDEHQGDWATWRLSLDPSALQRALIPILEEAARVQGSQGGLMDHPIFSHLLGAAESIIGFWLAGPPGAAVGLGMGVAYEGIREKRHRDRIGVSAIHDYGRRTSGDRSP